METSFGPTMEINGKGLRFRKMCASPFVYANLSAMTYGHAKEIRGYQRKPKQKNSGKKSMKTETVTYIKKNIKKIWLNNVIHVKFEI